jgi:hypothetical protein
VRIVIVGKGWELCDFDHLIFGIRGLEHFKSVLVFSINFLFIMRGTAFQLLTGHSLNAFMVDNRRKVVSFHKV